MSIKTIEWKDGAVRMVDQTRLPGELVYINVDNTKKMYEAIQRLSIRGAPALGIAGAYGLYLGIKDFNEAGDISKFFEVLTEEGKFLVSSRPTAVNLEWAVRRLLDKSKEMRDKGAGISKIKTGLLEEAGKILEEDRVTCRKIGENGFKVLKNFNSLLTHCNAGGLATGEYGTALAPIYVGKEKGKIFNVYADETRPLLQGSRITAFELKENGIPVTVICDNMAAAVMAAGKIDAVVVGADRIAANGDTANKIGTYGLALISKYHHVPFYVAAPVSTFDLSTECGKKIPIEEREGREIKEGFGRLTAPEEAAVYNPAFDVTPGSLITGIITEKGLIVKPFKNHINKLGC